MIDIYYLSTNTKFSSLYEINFVIVKTCCLHIEHMLIMMKIICRRILRLNNDRSREKRVFNIHIRHIININDAFDYKNIIQIIIYQTYIVLKYQNYNLQINDI